MNSLIFGSSGFVGRELRQTLMSKQQGFLRLAQRRPMDENVRDGCLVHVLPKSSKFISKEDLDTLLANVDTVYFLASATPHSLAAMDPESRAEALVENATIPLLVARAAAAKNVRQFIYVSSCGVHGEYTTIKAFNEASVFNAHDPYTQSKVLAEKTLLAAGSDIPSLTIVRPPMIYGPRLRGPMRYLLRSVALGIPLPLAGISDNRRSMIGVRNFCEFLYFCSITDGARDQVYVIADDDKTSTRDFLWLAARAARTSSRLLSVPRPVLSTIASAFGKRQQFERVFGNYEVDDSKARKELGWVSPHRVVDELNHYYFPLEFEDARRQ
jgi:nucleoside-diphosphate-sugar epimerase